MDLNTNKTFFVHVSNLEPTLVHLQQHHCIDLIDLDFYDTTDITDITQDILATVSGDEEPAVKTYNTRHCTEMVNIENRGDTQLGAILGLFKRPRTMW